MGYSIAWAVFLVLCIIAVPVASMLDKRKTSAPKERYDDSDFSQSDDQEQDEIEPLAEDDALAEGQDFAAEELPESMEPVVDDFSAFEEEFN